MVRVWTYEKRPRLGLDEKMANIEFEVRRHFCHIIEILALLSTYT